MVGYIISLIVNSEYIKSCVYSTGDTSLDVYNDLIVIESFVDKIHRLKIISDFDYNEYLKAKAGKRYNKKSLHKVAFLVDFFKPELSDFSTRYKED